MRGKQKIFTNCSLEFGIYYNGNESVRILFMNRVGMDCSSVNKSDHMSNGIMFVIVYDIVCGMFGRSTCPNTRPTYRPSILSRNCVSQKHAEWWFPLTAGYNLLHSTIVSYSAPNLLPLTNFAYYHAKISPAKTVVRFSLLICCWYVHSPVLVADVLYNAVVAHAHRAVRKRIDGGTGWVQLGLAAEWGAPAIGWVDHQQQTTWLRSLHFILPSPLLLDSSYTVARVAFTSCFAICFDPFFDHHEIMEIFFWNVDAVFISDSVHIICPRHISDGR